MNAAAWKERLGQESWDYIRGHEGSDDGGFVDSVVADILTRASEAGFVAPETKVEVSAGGTAVRAGGVQFLTARGLLKYWQARGHGWMIFRLEPLMKAVAGPLLPAFQQIWQAYEAQSVDDGLEPSEVVPGGWYGFVGGGQPPTVSDLLRALQEPVPASQPKLPSKTVEGPK